jgi:hypothetical protein
MSKLCRLRRLIPDEALFDRRVAGESQRSLARDYGVVHSTLGDFFRRPDGVLGLEAARRRLQAARRARQAMERELQQNVRKRAQEDAKHDRRLESWARRRTRRAGYEGWLDEHDAPRGLSSRERFSVNDDLAETVVAAAGGVEQVIDVTGLRTRENALHSVDAQIMRRALVNDAKFPSNARPDDRGLRRLVPDSELIRRGAAKEPARSIAADYGVCHTTILRYFKRSAVAKQLLRAQRRRDRPRGGQLPA